MIQYILDTFKPKKTKNGKWKEFNKQAILVAEGFYKNDIRHGPWRFYYESGELAIEENYATGKLHGRYASYHMNGVMMSEGHYYQDMREGPFYIYNERGTLEKVLIFEKNILLEETASTPLTQTA